MPSIIRTYDDVLQNERNEVWADRYEEILTGKPSIFAIAKPADKPEQDATSRTIRTE